MKKFFLKIILFCTIILAASIILSSFIYPKLKLTDYSWGSENLEAKRKYLLQNPNKYNTLFIGSSRVWKQIDPALFDTLVHSKEATCSFNLGENWMGAPEIYYVLENLINEDKIIPKYIFIELSKIKSINYSNIHTNRTHYWCNKKDYLFAIQTTLSSNFSQAEKMYNLCTYSIAYLDNILNLGYVTEALAIKNKNEQLIGNGFDCTSIRTKRDSALAKPFLADTSVVQKLAENCAAQFSKFEKDPTLLQKYNKVYMNRISSLVEECKTKGIQLIFCMPPRLDNNQYNELIPLYNQIFENNRIELSDSRKYPQLYIAKNSYNETHLNCTGAEDYTKLLAEKFKEILKRK